MNSDMDFKIGHNYKISMNKKLGSGAFGEIYHGKFAVMKIFKYRAKFAN